MPGTQFTVPSGPFIEIVEVERPDAHLNFATAFFGSEMRALQLVCAAARGRWPWAADFNNGRGIQPVLGIRVTLDP
ncbi:DUF4262 domain-containing protein [Mycobacterium sp.]|uniref:DUF4262 domain-containing protein n=1 Tax=Mycobacterium sp. TaxID=1785 RepID=UPI003F9CACC8